MTSQRRAMRCRDLAELLRRRAVHGPRIDPSASVKGSLRLAPGVVVDEHCLIGGGPGPGSVTLGAGSHVRSGSVIYAGVRAGKRFRTGHNVLVREGTRAGDDVLVGTGVIIEGHVTIGSRVSIQSRVFIPSNTRIGNDVFIGPGATLTNDRYPIRSKALLRGPTIEDGASIGGAAVLLPGVRIGSGAFVAAGAVVTRDVPPGTLAIGVPARTVPLPAKLMKPNRIARRPTRER